MVSLRCKMVVKTELENLGVHFRFIELGTVEIMDDFTAEQRKSLHKTLYIYLYNQYRATSGSGLLIAHNRCGSVSKPSLGP